MEGKNWEHLTEEELEEIVNDCGFDTAFIPESSPSEPS
jgi:hypothetical protein